jgi:putative transposase
MPAGVARWRRIGHFRQGRFGAVAMDEDHLAAASRHVALDPARARLVERARDWRRSSVHAHRAARSSRGSAGRSRRHRTNSDRGN